MRLNSELITSIFTLILGTVAFFATRETSFLGIVFVNYILAAMMILSLLVFIKGIIRPEMLQLFESVVERNNIFIGIAILLIYLVALPLIGFLPSSYVFYFTFNLYLVDGERFSTRNLIESALISMVVVTLFYFLFHSFLGVPLPEASLLAD